MFVPKFTLRYITTAIIVTGWFGLLVIVMSQSGCHAASGDTIVQANPGPQKNVDNTDLSQPSRLSTANNENSMHSATVYYFHRTVRCPGCLQIEFMADQAIRQSFPKELEQGNLLWLVLNMDEPENQPFVKEYDLDASTLVLVNARKTGNRGWKKLEKVWELHGDTEAFNQYIRTEIAESLSGEKK
jgi:hypothetical protein